jgi:glycosyltransferase involved in cell wall biosynthesis
MSRIVQVGAYPPPYGGVTVHLMRLHDALRQRGLDSTIIDLSPTPKDVPGVLCMSWREATSYLLDTLPRSVVHFHNFAPAHAGVYRRAARRHVTVLSLHNERFGDDLGALGLIRRRIALARLRRVHCIVVDSEHCRQIAADLWGPRARLRVIPEFIPPASIPALEHPAILELRSRCRFLLASNAWRLEFHRGQDLYGLDLLIELLRRLVHERGLDAGLVFLHPGSAETPYLSTLLDRARQANLGQRCLVVTEPLAESSSLWRIADVVVRSTNTDGNSLTVLEALSVGVPVVASDCVERPPGTVLFRTRDVDDLTDRVVDVLSDLPAHATRARRSPAPGSAEAFVSLYLDLHREWGSADA